MPPSIKVGDQRTPLDLLIVSYVRSLARTHFEVQGKLADVYFECHYFDVATGARMSDTSTGVLGQPNTAQARKIRGKWLLSFAEAGAPALSSGY